MRMMGTKPVEEKVWTGLNTLESGVQNLESLMRTVSEALPCD